MFSFIRSMFESPADRILRECQEKKEASRRRREQDIKVVCRKLNAFPLRGEDFLKLHTLLDSARKNSDRGTAPAFKKAIWDFIESKEPEGFQDKVWNPVVTRWVRIMIKHSLSTLWIVESYDEDSGDAQQDTLVEDIMFGRYNVLGDEQGDDVGEVKQGIDSQEEARSRQKEVEAEVSTVVDAALKAGIAELDNKFKSLSPTDPNAPPMFQSASVVLGAGDEVHIKTPNAEVSMKGGGVEIKSKGTVTSKKAKKEEPNADTTGA